MKIRQRLVVAFGLPAFVAAMLLALWANDVRQDRKRTVVVDESTPVFAGNGQGCDTREQIAVVQRGAVFSVRRIRYWKDCATIDITLPNDRLGHIVLGIGRVSMQPPILTGE